MIKKILILSDNEIIAKFLWDNIANNPEYDQLSFDFHHSGNIDSKSWLGGFTKMNVNKKQNQIISDYHLIISAHCKQIFPKELVNSVRCINIHPGYLPYNRGWYPHVFSIINGLPAGVTIHEMDEKIDHGPIIIRKEVELKPWDTSETLYERIIKLEHELIESNFTTIINNNYTLYKPIESGNINYKKDFEKLKNIDINKTGSFNDFFKILRALSFGNLNKLKIGHFEYTISINSTTLR